MVHPNVLHVQHQLHNWWHTDKSVPNSARKTLISPVLATVSIDYQHEKTKHTAKTTDSVHLLQKILGHVLYEFHGATLCVEQYLLGMIHDVVLGDPLTK